MRLELWGGVGMHRRPGRRRVSATRLPASGFAHRLDDLDRLAELGITRCAFRWSGRRYRARRRPSSTGAGPTSASRACATRHRARSPGLLHHGSGPALDQPARSRSSRSCWRVRRRGRRALSRIEHWTPVNEPLTTARFSGLYGHWYPHRRDDASFLRALVNQCRARCWRCGRSARRIPGAQLVQTEDLGKTFSTAAARLPGRAREPAALAQLRPALRPRRPRPSALGLILRERGVGEDELRAVPSGDGAPDIIGINHYLTSERFLDQRVELYPGTPAAATAATAMPTSRRCA